jgi:hypothetical protein
VWYSDNVDKPGKSRLYFYTGTGAKGAMIQVDYERIIREVVAVDMPTRPSGKVLLEDNHYSHGHKPGSPYVKSRRN